MAVRWPRGTGLTSYLSGCFCVLQLGDVFLHAAPIRNVDELCQARSLPTTRFPLRARSCERPGPFGGVDPPGNAIACWYYRSSQNPLGNGISTGIETVPVPDSVCARFLNSRLTAQLLISCITGAGTTPTRGAGDICLNAAITRLRRRRPNQLRPSIPRLPGTIPVVLSADFSGPLCCDCSIKERERRCDILSEK